jgi:PD-(D/E)XK nuclease superfamily
VPRQRTADGGLSPRADEGVGHLAAMAGSPERALNPTQREVLDRIRLPVDQRLVWPEGIRRDIHDRLQDELADVRDLIPDEGQLWVAKSALDAVHGCEARHRADRFEWSVPVARGRVAHKAIEMTVTWRGDPEPRELVDEAIGRLEEGDDGLADFLRTCGTAARVDLASQAVTVVDGFLTTFPPLTRGYRPTAEARRRWSLFDDAIVLSGRFDLTVGVPDGTRAGRAIIELKSGGVAQSHRDDLRFYALLETLVVGVPPMSIVGHYPDSGRADVEIVTADVLESALRRTVAGVRRLAELEYRDATPRRVPGPPCRWCPISDDCEPGRTWLHDTDDW